MTTQKLLIRLAGVSMAAAAVFLAGCAASGTPPPTGPHPVGDTADTYDVNKPDPVNDPNTVAVTINPGEHAKRDKGVHPVNLHFKADANSNIVAVTIPEKTGKHPKVKVVILPQTTGPHPITVVIDSAN